MLLAGSDNKLAEKTNPIASCTLLVEMNLAETIIARPGEDLDTDALASYLQSVLPGPMGTVEVTQFPGGSSNLTYLINVQGAEYVFRRPPFGNTVRTAHDMRREFDVLSKLSVVYPPAPRPLVYCDDESVIGSEFYLMERRSGLIIRGRLPGEQASPAGQNQLARFDTSNEYQNEICRAFIENLSKLHSLDYKTAGLKDLGKPEGYPRRQVEGWTKRYFAAKTDEHPQLEAAIGWLNANIPAESAASLVHNDYKFDNLMLDPADLTNITAVLDWEMVTIGDPLMDLGTTLGYWISADAGEEMMRMPFNPYVLMKNISRRDLAEMYAESSGRDISNIVYYYVFGTFKIAVICQQIYARYVKGLTKDERFSGFAAIVGRLGHLASHALERGTL